MTIVVEIDQILHRKLTGSDRKPLLNGDHDKFSLEWLIFRINWIQIITGNGPEVIITRFSRVYSSLFTE